MITKNKNEEVCENCGFMKEEHDKEIDVYCDGEKACKSFVPKNQSNSQQNKTSEKDTRVGLFGSNPIPSEDKTADRKTELESDVRKESIMNETGSVPNQEAILKERKEEYDKFFTYHFKEIKNLMEENNKITIATWYLKLKLGQEAERKSKEEDPLDDIFISENVAKIIKDKNEEIEMLKEGISDEIDRLREENKKILKKNEFLEKQSKDFQRVFEDDRKIFSEERKQIQDLKQQLQDKDKKFLEKIKDLKKILYKEMIERGDVSGLDYIPQPFIMRKLDELKNSIQKGEGKK